MARIIVNSSNLLPHDLIDFHCHLDLYPNYLEMIRESEELGIKTLTVTNAPIVWSKNQLLVQSCRHIRVALGLHPQLAHAYTHELSLFEQLLPETRYVGEVGLDGSSDFLPTFETQRDVFQSILKLCAVAGNKVLTVHSRRAATQVIDDIGTFLPSSKGRVVLHWFTGSRSEALRAIEAGCFFSINAKMLESAQRRKIIEALPQNRILTESDGPFAKIGPSIISPKDIGIVIHQLASIWSVPDVAAATIIKNNLKSLLA